ncbi:MAG: NAAT family transporter, partial [Burkholderiales bacterium]
MSTAQEYLRFLVTLTAVLDPFLAVPVFLTLTASRSAAARAALVRIVAVTVFAVLAAAALLGESILTLIGASLAAFRVGGGLVLLLMALAMLNARAGGLRQSQEEAAEVESGELQGLVPLAVPLLAGPGAISTTVIAAQKGGAAHLA